MAREADYRANALVRGLAILQGFTPRQPELTLSEIAAGQGITSSAAYRVVVTLEQEGYLARQGNRYRLAARVMDLGYRYLGSLDVWDLARAPAEALRNATGFTVHVAVLQGTEAVYIHRALSERAMVSNVPVGSRLPACQTTMGRVLLCDLPGTELDARFAGYAFGPTPDSLATLKAWLAKDRARGHVAQASDLAPGTFAIAAPIRSRQGRHVAAINLSGHVSQLGAEPALVAQVRAAADQISGLL